MIHSWRVKLFEGYSPNYNIVEEYSILLALCVYNAIIFIVRTEQFGGIAN